MEHQQQPASAVVPAGAHKRQKGRYLPGPSVERLSFLSSVSMPRLQLSNKLFELMNNIPHQPVAFVAFIGPKYSGKSILVDRLFETVHNTKGHSFSRLGPTVGSWIGDIPLKQDKKTVVYAIDCEGIDDLANDINQQDLLRLLHGICSVIVLNMRVKDIRYQQLFTMMLSKFDKEQAIDSPKEQISPPQLIIVRRDQPDTSLIVEQVSGAKIVNLPMPLPADQLSQAGIMNLVLGSMTPTFRQAVKILSELLINAQPRTFNRVQINCNMTSILAQKYTKMLQSEHCLNLSKGWQSILEEVYISAYNCAIITYSQYLTTNLKDQYVAQAKLREHCREAMVRALDFFSGDAMPVESKRFYIKYKNKLLDLIYHKEDQLFQLNALKCNQYRAEGLDRAMQDVKRLIDRGEADPSAFLEKMKVIAQLNATDSTLHKSYFLTTANALAATLKTDRLAEQVANLRQESSRKDSQIDYLKLKLQAAEKPPSFEKMIEKVVVKDEKSEQMIKLLEEQNQNLQSTCTSYKMKLDDMKSEMQMLERKMKQGGSDVIARKEKELQQLQKKAKEQRDLNVRQQNELKKQNGNLNETIKAKNQQIQRLKNEKGGCFG